MSLFFFLEHHPDISVEALLQFINHTTPLINYFILTFNHLFMTLKLGTLVLLAASAASMSAQTAVQDIYSQNGEAALDGTAIVYNFGSWHAGNMDGEVTLWPSLFEEMLANTEVSYVEGVMADIDGIEVNWNSVDKVVSVYCDDDMLGRAAVLISDLNGVNRGLQTLEDTHTQLSISNFVPGTYVVAVAVDGKLVKTFKIILK